MSIKQRLRTAEKRMGVTDGDPIHFRTFYENKDGSSQEVSRMIVFPCSGHSFYMRREPGETQDQFDRRADSQIQDFRFGRRPAVTPQGGQDYLLD